MVRLGGPAKLFFLPGRIPIFYAVIGELSLRGGCDLIFAAFLVLGWRVALATTDPFGRLVAFGLAGTIGLAAALNMGVVTGLLPTKGLPLPFISYGGSSLVVNLFAVGILFNISRQRGVR
jgi:cell division protein FtsW